MAREAITIIGTVVGAIYGQPGLGYAIGSAIGNAVDPLINKAQGPQIGDLAVQFSTWGVMIPWSWGAMRMAGNVIWSTKLIETENTESEDGKGGPVNETTTYTYSINLAVSLQDSYGRPAVGIRKIFANGTLIYNAGDDADLDTVIASQQIATGFRFYDGNEEQMPIALMEADKGVGNVPAYRGQAIVVFEGLQLADYGNRVPNIEFEVIGRGSLVFSEKSRIGVPSYPTSFSTYFASGTAYADSDSFYRFQGQWDSNYTRPFIIKATRQFLDGSTIPFVLADSTVDGNGNAYMPRFKSDVPAGAVYTNLSQQIEIFTALGKSIFVLPAAAMGLLIGVKKGDYLAFADKASGGATYVWSSASVSSALMVIPGASSRAIQGLDITQDKIFIAANISGSIWIEEYALTNLNLISSFNTGMANQLHGFIAKSESEFYVFNGDIYLVSTSGNKLIGSIMAPDGSNTNHGDFFNNSDVFFVGFGQIGMPQEDIILSYSTSVQTITVPISDIVEDQCMRAGVTDIDVSEIDNINVDGYAIKRQGSARTNIDQLQKFAFFDAVDSDGALKFPVRGSEAIAIIPFEDVGAHVFGSDVGDALAKVRAQEVDLPRRIAVNYFNKDADYQPGSEHAQRLITDSDNETTVQLAIAMDRDKAAQIADVLLFDAYTARTQFAFSTTSKYAYLEPADVINLEAPEATYTIRIIAKDDSGSVLKFSAALENIVGYQSNAVGGSSGQSQSQIGAVGPTLMQLLDIPLIRDQDDNAGFYAAMSGVNDGWRGASLLKSFDDLSFVSIGSVFNSAIMGHATTALGNWTGGNVFDESSFVDVTVYRGELSSADYLAVLNGANACVIGSEILQFKNAVLTGPKQYRLSGLLRGRRGTEQHIGTHTASDRFVFFSVAGTLRPDAGPAEIGASRYYKPVSFGQRQTAVSSTQFANTAAGLKPYSPVHPRGGKQVNGDFVIGWTRRTRLDGGWRDSVDVPIGETTEAYEVDIVSGATVKRTMISATPSVTYTGAMQTADFGSAQSSITVNIYQMSSVVGRGFPANKTY